MIAIKMGSFRLYLTFFIFGYVKLKVNYHTYFYWIIYQSDVDRVSKQSLSNNPSLFYKSASPLDDA